MYSENLKLNKNSAFQNGEEEKKPVESETLNSEIHLSRFVLTGLNELLVKIQKVGSAQDLTNQVISYLAVYTHAQVGLFYLWNESAHRLELSSGYNIDTKKEMFVELSQGDDLVQRAAVEKQTVLVSNSRDDYTLKMCDICVNQIVVMPIFYEGNLQGVVELGHSWLEFSGETLELLRLSSVIIGMVIKIIELKRIITLNSNSSENQQILLEESIQLHQMELQQANEELQRQLVMLQEKAVQLAFQNIEKEARTAETELQRQCLMIMEQDKKELAVKLLAMSALATANAEKAEHLANLSLANEQLFVINNEFLALNDVLNFQNIEKEARAAEFVIANKKLAIQNRQKEAQAAELIQLNQALAAQNNEKEARTAELILLNKELETRNMEKEIRVAELACAYEAKELFRNQVNHMQKLEIIGRLTSGIAHDFNNILACMMGYNEMNRDIFDAVTDEASRTDLENNTHQIDLAGQRAVALINKMLTYCRKDTTKKDKMRVLPAQEIINEVLEMLYPMLTSQIKIEFINKCHVNEGDCVHCDQRSRCVTRVEVDVIELHQVLMNLAVNARDAMKERGGIIIFSLHKTPNWKARCVACGMEFEGDFVELDVADNGTGIQPKIINRIFDPFFTTKPQGEGTGLGLSAVSGIVHHSSGHILIDSKRTEPNKGTTFRLFFPVQTDVPILE